MDERMNQFRLASRELFNHFFRISNPYDNDGWQLKDRFSIVEATLFEKLVTEPADLPKVDYGTLQTAILVLLKDAQSVPAMVNREVSSGYWDFGLREITSDARLGFVSYFDWDQLGYRDNRYVRVQIEQWPAHLEAVGKHALIESHHVRFAHAAP
jgi:hypothetical protein